MEMAAPAAVRRSPPSTAWVSGATLRLSTVTWERLSGTRPKVLPPLPEKRRVALPAVVVVGAVVGEVVGVVVVTVAVSVVGEVALLVAGVVTVGVGVVAGAGDGEREENRVRLMLDTILV